MRSPLSPSTKIQDEQDLDTFLQEQERLKAEYDAEQEQKRLEAVKKAEADAKISIERELLETARSSRLNELKQNIDYTPELSAEICRRVASGEMLKAICEEQSMPPISSVLDWIEETDKAEFKRAYVRATKLRNLVFEDELILIADDSTNDYIEKKNSRTGDDFTVINQEALARSKMRIEARLKILRADNPARWGDNPNAAEAAAALQRNQAPRVLIQFITPPTNAIARPGDDAKVIEQPAFLKIDIEEALKRERKIG